MDERRIFLLDLIPFGTTTSVELNERDGRASTNSRDSLWVRPQSQRWLPFVFGPVDRVVVYLLFPPRPVFRLLIVLEPVLVGRWKSE